MSKNLKERLKFNSWTLGARGAEIFEKSAEAIELERINPLRGVDEWRLGQIFDDARDGIFADLAWLYNEIESVEPALASCCDSRESAASECGWLVKTADAQRTRNYDEILAEEQRDALLREYGAVEDDITELACHLTGAFFRSAAHAQPLWNEDGTLGGFRMLDLWNMALDRKSGIWYWNADASRDEGAFEPIAKGEIISLCATRHIDHAALPIFIRAALGAKRYGVWLDRFGIPPVGIIMPPNAEKGEQAAYMDLARKFARGGSGILPSGSQIVYGSEARATCPFTDFIRFQQQQIFMIGLGRVQSGDNAGDNLGGNAAGVVESSFKRIVRRDGRRIARAINDCATAKILERLFPGREKLAYFAWDTEEKRTGREVLEDAGLAKSAGLEIDLDQLQELTGYILKKAPEQTPGMPFRAFNARGKHKTPSQSVANPLQNARNGLEVEGEGAEEEALRGAFSRDLGPAAKMMSELLEEPTREKAALAAAKLVSMLPENPEAGEVIAEAIKAAMAEERGTDDEGGEEKETPRERE